MRILLIISLLILGGYEDSFAKDSITLQLTELHRASFYDDIKKINKLLDNGADVNAKANNGITPLHMAAHEGHVKAIKVLLQRGAAPNALNGNDEKPLDVAIRKGNADAADILFLVTKTDKKNLGYTPAPQNDEK